jgi:hypothetical protein
MRLMSFCEHCEGQRFDRARVLRALRQLARQLRTDNQRPRAGDALKLALNAVRQLDIPHLEYDVEQDHLVH